MYDALDKITYQYINVNVTHLYLFVLLFIYEFIYVFPTDIFSYDMTMMW